MAARLLDGEALAQRLRPGLAARAAALRRVGRVPCLATVLLGEDPASAAYIGRKHADLAALGLGSRDIRLPARTPRAALLERIAALNAEEAVTGVLVQLPLPAPLDGTEMTAAVLPGKDVDGLHPANLGRLLAGQPGLRPCTPLGVLALLRGYDVALAGRRVTIVGRGALVGRPLAMLLSLKGVDAVVTLAHGASGDLAEHTRGADVVISCAGMPGLIGPGMIAPGAAVVGVGISYVGGEMVSDIAAEVAQVAGHVTPMHGSVGALTRAFLASNLLDIAEAAG